MATLRVFTDGSCVGNGNQMAVGGYGVFVDDPMYPEIYRYLLPENTGGLVTSNRAELMAVMAALWMLHRDERDLNLYIDSQYVKLMVAKYCFASIEFPSNAKNIDMLKVICELYKLHYKNVGRRVTMFHVPSHTSGTDAITRGNRRADELATMGRNIALRMMGEHGRVEKQAVSLGKRLHSRSSRKSFW